MAFESGTATNYLDLLAKVRTFLTTNATLVADGEQWVEQRWTGGTELILKGPGLTGTEEIYIGFRAFENVPEDYYNWELMGSVGYFGGEVWSNQPNKSPNVYVHLWNDTIPYWFYGNGQRFIMVAKISTTYQSLYLGKFLPYGTPSQYPYPLLVSGTSNSSTWRWSVTDFGHAGFARPGNGTYLLTNQYVWQRIRNIYQASTSEAPDTGGRWMYPTSFKGATSSNLYYFSMSAMNHPDGTYDLVPFELMFSNLADKALLGKLDDTFWLTGFSNASENTITLGPDTYDVFQNTWRTGFPDFFAVKR